MSKMLISSLTLLQFLESIKPMLEEYSFAIIKEGFNWRHRICNGEVLQDSHETATMDKSRLMDFISILARIGLIYHLYHWLFKNF